MIRSLPNAPPALQTHLLIYSWCSLHLSLLLPPLPFQSPFASALVMFLQRVCLRRAWVIHHGAWVNDFWLPLWGHNALAQRTGPSLGKTQSHKCIWEDIKGNAYKNYDSSMEVRWRKSARQTQTVWVCCLESTWSSCAAVLNIFLCNVQSLESDLKASVVYSFPTAIFQNEGMPWQC